MDFEKVKEIIVETLSCDADKVTPDARLAEDLEADSLAAVEGSYLGQAFNGCVLSQEEAVQQIEEKVLAAFSEQSVEEEAAPAEAEEASPAAEDDYPEGDPFAADPVDEPTRRINLNDLKFGRNYSGGDD